MTGQHLTEDQIQRMIAADHPQLIWWFPLSPVPFAGPLRTTPARSPVLPRHLP